MRGRDVFISSTFPTGRKRCVHDPEVSLKRPEQLAPCPISSAKRCDLLALAFFARREVIELVRANSERLAPPQVVTSRASAVTETPRLRRLPVPSLSP